MFKELVVLDFYIFEVTHKMTYITVQKTNMTASVCL